MLGDYESSDDDKGPNLPAGVLRSRGGWTDSNNLEMEHQRERIRAAEDGERSSVAHAAVDLSQFRNEEVGKGYKAKHVVRQREAAPSSTQLVDKTGGKFSKKEAGSPSSSKKRRRDDGDKGERSKCKQPKDNNPLERYLACKGMRDFMKDVDKILKQR